MAYASLVILFNENGEVLLLKRSNKVDSYSGKYGFPGGKIEDGETSLEAAVREVKEETDLNIKQKNLAYVFTMSKDNSKDIIFYIAKEWNGKVKVDWESDEFFWAKPSLLDSIDLVPTPNIVFDLIKAWAKFFISSK